jgi:hypothetical protein
MNWKGCGRKLLRNYHSTCLDRLRKGTKNVGQDHSFQGREWNPGPPEHKATMPSIRRRHSVAIHIILRCLRSYITLQSGTTLANVSQIYSAYTSILFHLKALKTATFLMENLERRWLSSEMLRRVVWYKYLCCHHQGDDSDYTRHCYLNIQQFSISVISTTA